MHWKKNRMVNPEAKAQIIQHGQCLGCGRAVKFYYGEAGQFCLDRRKEASKAWADEVAERIAERVARRSRNR
jgi:hypothetical protein